MDQYEILANKTRNLEQKYTSYIVRKYSKILSDMKKDTYKLEEADQSLVADLNTKIAELENRNKILEKRSTEDSIKIKELENECKRLGDELVNSKKGKAANKIQNVVQSSADDVKGFKGIEEKHNQILSAINTISNLQKESSTKLGGLETLLNKINKKPFPQEEKFDNSIYIKKIKDLEDNIEKLKSENFILSKNETTLKSLKESVFLLEESVKTKDRLIDSQRKEIENLKSQNIIGGIELPDIDDVSKKVKKTVKKLEPKSLKEDKKVVNVENLIRDENKSFFNNLSFTNSSPLVTKKFQKKF